MGDIVLSAGVRQNLLSLQNTAELMATTQNRLATGKKVNSALDNATNFFTSSALQSRASDLNALLDAMNSGIKTLEAADNGISAIVKTVESMQATLRQARQDKSFKTDSFTLDPARTGNISFAGGAVGATAVNVALSVTAAATTLTGTGANFGTNFTGGAITVNGTSVTIRGDTAAAAASATGAGGSDLSIADPDLSALNGQSVTLSDGTNTVSYTFTNAASGQKAALLAALGTSGFTVSGTAAGLNASRADGANFTVTTSNGAVATAIGIANNTTTTDGVAAFDATAATVEADFDNAGITGLTAAVVGGQVELSLASGTPLTLAGSNTLLTAIGFGTGNQTSSNGTVGGLLTVDQLVTAINGNASLTDKILASNDNGKLRIQNISTADLSIGGIDSGGNLTGGANSKTIAGNEVRRNLVTQFNELRNQLDKLADDSSFNGVNLLRGDKLKVNLNETGTSILDVQARDTAGVATSISNVTLDITLAVNADFDADTSVDARLDALTTALGRLRSHASSFGSNLSIVENRTDFTKAMINTLQTGADGLVLADTNEEAANMLALQTRQQLSSTALSLASQADQAVLRLFG